MSKKKKLIGRLLVLLVLFSELTVNCFFAPNVDAENMDYYYFSSPNAIVFRYEVQIRKGNTTDRGTASIVLRGMLNGNYAIDHSGIESYYGPWSRDDILKDTAELLVPRLRSATEIGGTKGTVQVLAPKGASRSYGNEYLLVDNRGNSQKIEYLAHPTDTECSSLRDIYIPMYNFIKENYGSISGDYMYEKDGEGTRVYYSAKLRDDYGFNVGDGGDDKGGENGKLRDCKPGPVDSGQTNDGSSDGTGSSNGTTDGSSSAAEVNTVNQISRPQRDNTCVPTAILGNGEESCDDSGDGTGPIGNVIDTVTTVASFGVGIVGMVGITVSGVQYMTAAGSEEKIRKSKRRMAEIVIGVAAYALIYALINWLSPGGA